MFMRLRLDGFREGGIKVRKTLRRGTARHSVRRVVRNAAPFQDGEIGSGSGVNRRIPARESRPARASGRFDASVYFISQPKNRRKDWALKAFNLHDSCHPD
jgi:hypothetical protein